MALAEYVSHMTTDAANTEGQRAFGIRANFVSTSEKPANSPFSLTIHIPDSLHGNFPGLDNIALLGHFGFDPQALLALQQSLQPKVQQIGFEGTDTRLKARIKKTEVMRVIS